MVKVSTEIEKPKTVEERKKSLKQIQKKKEDGIPILTLQSNDMIVSIPIDIPILSGFLKSKWVANRTIFKVLDIKVCVDV